MGKIAKCCCCPPIESLPSVSMSGMTSSGWSGVFGMCCFKNTLTPIVPPTPVQVCSEPTDYWNYHQVCDYQELLFNYTPKFFNAPAPQDNNGPVNNCDCVTPCPTISVCGSVKRDTTVIHKRCLLVKYRLKEIQVFISKIPVTCPTLGTIDKYALTSVYVYEWGRKDDAETTKWTTTTALTEGTCCTKRAGEENPFGQGTEFYCSDFSVPYQSPFGPTPYLTFTRIKLFDDLPPSGTYSFSNADKLDSGCTIPVTCHSRVFDTTRICIVSQQAGPTPPWVYAANPVLGVDYLAYAPVYALFWQVSYTGECTESYHLNNISPPCQVLRSRTATTDPPTLATLGIGFYGLSNNPSASAFVVTTTGACRWNRPCGTLPFSSWPIYEPNYPTPGSGSGFHSLTGLTIDTTIQEYTERTICVDAPSWSFDLG
jgi:hypothetical protein